MTKAELQQLINTNIADDALITPEKDREVRNAMLNYIGQLQYFIGEIKWLKMTNLQVTENFDSTGLGTSDAFLGWAICNGENGTTNDDGRVSIAFGLVYNTLGSTGGSKDAVVVEHSHVFRPTGATYGENTSAYYDVFMASAGDAFNNGNQYKSTDNTGESGTNKNMQPYVVELKIQRIA